MLKSFFIFLFFVLGLHFSLWASPIPPDKRIKTLSTQHFEILYYAEQQELAQHYAKQFEKAWAYLGGVFLSYPHKLTLVLNDSTDQANGFATRVPYPFIMLFPVLPDLNDSISEFENWSLELAVHELAHVLTFEPAGGVMKPLRSVFGTIIAPNILLPTWWKEGLSVWTETAIGNAGRLRSIYQESILRSWIGTRNFYDFTLPQANEAIPRWPWGSNPYFFGSLTMSYIIQKHGESVMQQLNEKHGATVPYFYKSVTRSLTENTYEGLYQEGLSSWENKAREQVKTLSAIPLDKPQKVESADMLSRSPSISGDGQFLTWVAQEKKPEARLKLALLNDEGKIVTVKELKKGRIVEARFFPRSQKIIYNELKMPSQVELYSDLYVYDVQKDKSERLTRKLRGREARVNPEETEVVFVGLEGGRTSLKTLDLKTKETKTLFTSALDERIASPLYLQDDQILYSFLQKGKESLHVWNLKENKSTVYSTVGQRLRRPLKVGNNVWVMSDQNRIFNLYTLNNSQLSTAKTHVQSTILDYAIHEKSHSGYAVMMDPDGPLLYYFSPEILTAKRGPLPKLTPMAGTVSKLPPAEEIPTESQETSRPYKLWPHYWIPFISGSSASNGLLISVSTSGQDPSMQHMYGLGIVYDTALDETSYSINYTNRAFRWPWLVQSLRQARNFAGDTDSVYYNETHAFAIMPDTMRVSDEWATSFAYVFNRYDSDFAKYERQGPQATIAFSDIQQTLWMISPEEGGSASVTWSHFLKSTELEAHNQYRLQTSYYFSKWLPEHHAISFEARALLTDKVIPSGLGDASTLYSSGLTSDYLIRGYLENQFVGRNILNANLEYRFPVMSFSKWRSLLPFFLKRIHGALVLDAISLDGYGYKESIKANVPLNRDKIFGSGGVEARFDTTVGYVLPIQFVIGLHQPFQDDFSNVASYYLQIKSGFGF